MFNILFPHIIGDIRKIKRKNKELRSKLRKYANKDETFNWGKADEKNYNTLSTVQNMGSYCDKVLQDYMHFQIREQQAKSMCITEWANTAVFLMTEFSKVCQLYFKTTNHANERSTSTNHANERSTSIPETMRQQFFQQFVPMD